MRLPPRAPRGARLVLAWAGVALFQAWLCWPLLVAGNRVFGLSASGDVLLAGWFYGHVARALAGEADLDELSGFNWPEPLSRHVEFPNAADAVLAAPVNLLLDWPARWHATLALAALVNAAGAAALARSAGAGALGVLVAGVLGASWRQEWRDFALGRMSAAWPGLALLAGAAWLRAVGAATPRQAVVRALVAGALGALAAAAYPPWLLLAAPVVLALGAGPLLRASRWGRLAAAGAPAIGLLLVARELVAMLGAAPSPGPCPPLWCPVELQAMDLSRMALRGGPASLWLSGERAGLWLAALPALLLGPRRRVALAIAAVGALGLLAAAGPCPELHGVRIDLPDTGPVAWLVVRLGCAVRAVHDHARLAFPAVAGATVLAGLGAGAGGRLRLLVAALVVAATASVVAGLVPEQLSPRLWHRVEVPATVPFLRRAAPGPLAELPFDASGQFLAALLVPDGRPRLNPLRPADPPPEQPFLRWLFLLGRGQLTRPLPTREQAAASGLRWVVFDPNRCVRAACPQGTTAALEAVLGPPIRGEFGIYAWDLERLADGDASPR